MGGESLPAERRDDDAELLGSAPGGPPTIDAVAAGLRRDGGDVALYSGFLLSTLVESLPPELVEVERKRSLADKMKGREGEVVAVTVRLADQTFRLDRPGTGTRPKATVGHSSGGVTLSSKTVSVDDWSAQLAAALVAVAAGDARTADALARLTVAGGSSL